MKKEVVAMLLAGGQGSCLDLMLFYNSSDEEYQKSMEMVISRLEDE